MAFVKFNPNRFTPDPKPEAKAKPVQVKRIKKASTKREAENKIYRKEAKEFVKGKICPVTGGKATEVHHKKGRIGKLLLDKKYWLAVSAAGHKKIELNPDWAKEMGYSLNRL